MFSDSSMFCYDLLDLSYLVCRVLLPKKELKLIIYAHYGMIFVPKINEMTDDHDKNSVFNYLNIYDKKS